MWTPYDTIGRPREAHNVESPEAYRAFQARIIAHNKAARPSLKWRDPFDAIVPVTPFINAGRWVVLCADCGNAPIYDPDWQLACCPECGATYANVAPPDGYEDIEAVLLARPSLPARSWNTEVTLKLGPAEDLATLVAQNVEAGDDVPAHVIATLAARLPHSVVTPGRAVSR